MKQLSELFEAVGQSDAAREWDLQGDLFRQRLNLLCWNGKFYAHFIMNHREYFPNWKADVKGIFDWVYKTLGNKEWIKYGVVVVNEQTAYKVPGNSHSSRGKLM